MTTEERKQRIVSRGEDSGHCHVIIGGNIKQEDVKNDYGDVVEKVTILEVKKGEDCFIKHLVESQWIEHGKEVWTGKHTDIKIEPGRYKIVHQQVFDPVAEQKRRVLD